MHEVSLEDCLQVHGLVVYINTIEFRVSYHGPKNKYLVNTRTGRQHKPFKHVRCQLDQINADKLANFLEIDLKTLEAQIQSLRRTVTSLHNTMVGHELEYD